LLLLLLLLLLLQYTMLEFAKFIREEVGSKSEILHKPATQDDPQKRRPDISRAKRVLKSVPLQGSFPAGRATQWCRAVHARRWEPKVTVREGLRRTIAYFKEVRSCRWSRAPGARCAAGEG
jgi:nucleoside-diphosphate-sugar epimerase